MKCHMYVDGYTDQLAVSTRAKLFGSVSNGQRGDSPASNPALLRSRMGSCRHCGLDVIATRGLVFGVVSRKTSRAAVLPTGG